MNLLAAALVWSSIATAHPCLHTYTGSDGPDVMDESADPCDLVIKGLAGDDILIGGSGNNTLIGNNGADVLTGGCCGNDIFQYNAISNSTELVASGEDTIEDFDVSRDAIDLSRICATITGGCTLSNSFTNVPGQVAYRYAEIYKNGVDYYVTIVELDADGDGWGDLGIWLLGGKLVLTAQNFIL